MIVHLGRRLIVAACFDRRVVLVPSSRDMAFLLKSARRRQTPTARPAEAAAGWWKILCGLEAQVSQTGWESELGHSVRQLSANATPPAHVHSKYNVAS